MFSGPVVFFPLTRRAVRLAAHNNALRSTFIISYGLLIASGIFAQRSDGELFQDAESRFRSKEYEIALDRYDTLIRQFPRSSYVPDTQFRRAVCLFRLEKQDESLALFRRVEERYSSTQFIAFVPFWTGIVEYNRGDYSLAATDLRRFVDGGEPTLLRQARLYLAISEDKLGNQDTAVRVLEQMMEEDLTPAVDSYSITLLASLYMKRQDYHEIIKLTDSVALPELASSDMERMQLYRAEAFWHLAEYDASRRLYERLLSAPPEISSIAYQRLFILHQREGNERELQNVVLNAETELSGSGEVLSAFWLRIGIESFQQRKFDLAKSYFQRVWNMRNRVVVTGLVPIYLAEIEKRQKNLDQAVEYLVAFLDLSDDRRELVLFRLGGLYLDLGNWDAGSRTFQTFLEEFPISEYRSEGALQLAYSLYKLARYADAITLVDGQLESALAGAYTSDFLLLKAVLHKKTGNLGEAARTLQEYLPLNPADTKAQMDLIRLYFRQEDYERVISEVEKVQKSVPFSDPASSYFLIARYMLGLSYISKQDYELAAQILEGLNLQSMREADLLLIYPYVLFYRGWTYYRNGLYGRAEGDFAALIEATPDHVLQPRAAYLAGWCAYVQGKYDDSGTYLQQISRLAGGELQIKGDFMYAKSLLSNGSVEEAAVLFETIYLDYPDSALTDDALFEYAGVLSTIDKIDESIQYYRKLWKEFPKSPLAEEGMYRRGELLYSSEEFPQARDAFYEYRLQFPRGKLYDAALYWGGMASFNSGEPFGAVLLWEKIVDLYIDSTFRADALLKTAEIYEESGDFRKALNFYGELISLYPAEARAISAERRTEKLRFLILGQGEQEAELSAVISTEGSGSREGREAILELARIYIYKSGSKQNQAPALLDELIEKQQDDPEIAARAHYLYGEYYYRKNDLQTAAQEFLNAVLLYPQDRDLAAQSLYKAAEMASLAGNRSEAEDLVKRIESLFPSSQWVEAGKKLLGDRS